MTDLSTLMNRATADIGDATTVVIDDDMARAQRARRKRLRAGGFSGVAAAATLAIGLPLIAGGSPASAVDLIDYTGAQPDGFTLVELPEGWHLYVSDDSSLVLSPNNDPLIHDPGSGLIALEGRISISLVDEEFLPPFFESRTMAIDDTTARVWDMIDEGGASSGAVTVMVPQGEGDYLSVQLPRELHWTDAEASRFIEGIDVDDDARHTAG